MKTKSFQDAERQQTSMLAPLERAALLIVFLMVSITSYLAAYSLGVFKLSHGKMGPTEIRLLLMIGNVFLIYHPHTHIMHRVYLLFDVGGVVSIIGMFSILVFSSI